MKKGCLSGLILLALALGTYADEFGGFSVSNTTSAAVQMVLNFDRVDWQEDSIHLKGQVMNEKMIDVSFAQVDFSLLDEEGAVLAEKDIPLEPQIIRPHAFAAFDLWVDVSEKPATIVYEVSAQ